MDNLRNLRHPPAIFNAWITSTLSYCSNRKQSLLIHIYTCICLHGKHRGQFRTQSPQRCVLFLFIHVVLYKLVFRQRSKSDHRPRKGTMNVSQMIVFFCIGVWSTETALANSTLNIQAKQAIFDITIDGSLNDWGKVEWIPLGEGLPGISAVKMNELLDHGVTEPPGTAQTAADLSGAFAIKWNKEFLYLAADITDNVRVVGRGQRDWGWWIRDGVSLFLDVPNDGDGLDWVSGDHSFSFIADNDIVGWWRHGDKTGHREVAMPDVVEYTVLLGDGGNYTLEAAIPMDLLGEFTPEWKPPFAGKNMGFILLVTDPDGEQPDWGGQLIYGGDFDHDKNWPDLILVENRPKETQDNRPETGQIEGQILLRSTGEAWMGGEVNVFNGDGQEVTSTFVDHSGRYEMRLTCG